MKRIAGLLLAACLLSPALVSCGAAGCRGSCTEPAVPPAVFGNNGPFHAMARPATLHAGQTVLVSLRVEGPIQYEIGCVQTLHIWAEDSSRQQVWSEPQPMIACMALGYKSLAAGEVANFKADWPTSTSLAAGTYTIHGLFLTVLPPGAGMRVRENLPPLPVQISG